MARLFSILSIWLVLLGSISVIMNHWLLSTSEQIIPINDSQLEEDVTYQDVLQQAQDAYIKKDYLTALGILERHETLFSGLPSGQAHLRYDYWLLRGYCHTALWQYVEAEQSWRSALISVRSAKQKAQLTELLTTARRALDDINTERHLNNLYRASPHVGPAATLSGKIALIYVFVNNSALSSWSLRDRSYVMRTWASAQQWLQQSALQHNVQTEFVHRLFVINKNPDIRRIKLHKRQSTVQNADRLASLAVQHLGHANVMSFVEQIKKEESADQVMLMFHVSQQGRSFASRCLHRCGEQGEFVFLMEPPKPKFWQALEYAQAHESLHLFGADDLYNIDAARHYAVRDIMNYPSKLLDASTMEPITAYAVGLREDFPATPFKVKSYAPRRYIWKSPP